MDLTNIQTIKSFLLKHGIHHPSKRLGQNFLINKNVLKKLIDAADITKTDTVLEVGAGIGTITIALAKRAKTVVAVEKDKNLIPILEETTKDFSNIEILQGDILKLTIEELIAKLPGLRSRSGCFGGVGQNCKIENYKLIGNIPYYLTARLIRKFLEADKPPELIVLMVQKEMAQRMCASPPRMSILSVSVQLYAEPKIASYVPRSSFWPMPKVDSAILKIIPHQKTYKLTHDRELSDKLFFKIVRAGFSNPRKQLANNLSRGLEISREETQQWLTAAGIEPRRRAETLTVEEWLGLTKIRNSNIEIRNNI